MVTACLWMRLCYPKTKDRDVWSRSSPLWWLAFPIVVTDGFSGRQ
jgi:hypothetical protein